MKTRINRRHYLNTHLWRSTVAKGVSSVISNAKMTSDVWWSFIFLMQPMLIKAIDCVTDGIKLLFKKKLVDVKT